MSDDIVFLYQVFSYGSAAALLLWSGIHSLRVGRPTPLFLVCIAALSIFWVEAPYDWTMYVQFHPDLPRAPKWGPLGATWGGLPAMVPAGYVMYFVLPAVVASWLALKIQGSGPRRPYLVLTVGLVIGVVWAAANNINAADFGLYRYGRVPPNTALFPGTVRQYPLYDALAMGMQMMVFTYLLATRINGQDIVHYWLSSRTAGKPVPAWKSIFVVVVAMHIMYLSLVIPHLIVNLAGLATVAPVQELYEGIPNQPL